MAFGVCQEWQWEAAWGRVSGALGEAGLSDYAAFAHDILKAISDRPISLEVFSDDFDYMRRQAKTIAYWAGNVYVKIPVTNTRGDSSVPLIRDLAAAGIKVNVTAMTTLRQVRDASAVLLCFA